MEKLPDMYVRYYASCFDIQDCPHVSRTLEEFYTVRCQVTDMKNLYVSFLDPHLHVYIVFILDFLVLVCTSSHIENSKGD